MVEANKPILLKATIIGGSGNDVTGAVRQYINLRGFPSIPKPPDAQIFLNRPPQDGWIPAFVRATNTGTRFRELRPPRRGRGDVSGLAEPNRFRIRL